MDIENPTPMHDSKRDRKPFVLFIWAVLLIAGFCLAAIALKP